MTEEHLAYHKLLAREPSYRRRSEVFKKYQSWTKATGGKKSGELPKDYNLILSSEKNFPTLLREIPNPPHGLYFQGDLDTRGKAVAIVGTRKASSKGLQQAYDIARAFAKAGVTVVSGLALGLDAAAHRGALDGGGKTFAVLPAGFDNLYPRQNRSLAEQILSSKGALISEYHPQRTVEKYQFLERNRIVSGLSLLTLVIEAPKRSGALSTAAHCVDQNRELAVIPGAIDDENYLGSNRLIQEGAFLLTGVDDLFDILGI